MKKIVYSLAVMSVIFLLTGCGTYGLRQGYGFTIPGAIVASGTQGGSTEPNFEILKRPYQHLRRVTGEASQTNILLLFSFGDASIEAAQQDALMKVQGADALINRNFDVKYFSLFGTFTIVTLQVTGDAIDYTDLP